MSNLPEDVKDAAEAAILENKLTGSTSKSTEDIVRDVVRADPDEQPDPKLFNTLTAQIKNTISLSKIDQDRVAKIRHINNKKESASVAFVEIVTGSKEAAKKFTDYIDSLVDNRMITSDDRLLLFASVVHLNFDDVPFVDFGVEAFTKVQEDPVTGVMKAVPDTATVAAWDNINKKIKLNSNHGYASTLKAKSRQRIASIIHEMGHAYFKTRATGGIYLESLKLYNKALVSFGVPLTQVRKMASTVQLADPLLDDRYLNTYHLTNAEEFFVQTFSKILLTEAEVVLTKITPMESSLIRSILLKIQESVIFAAKVLDSSVFYDTANDIVKQITSINKKTADQTLSVYEMNDVVARSVPLTQGYIRFVKNVKDFAKIVYNKGINDKYMLTRGEYEFLVNGSHFDPAMVAAMVIVKSQGMSLIDSSGRLGKNFNLFVSAYSEYKKTQANSLVYKVMRFFEDAREYDKFIKMTPEQRLKFFTEEFFSIGAEKKNIGYIPAVYEERSLALLDVYETKAKKDKIPDSKYAVGYLVTTGKRLFEIMTNPDFATTVFGKKAKPVLDPAYDYVSFGAKELLSTDEKDKLLARINKNDLLSKSVLDVAKEKLEANGLTDLMKITSDAMKLGFIRSFVVNDTLFDVAMNITPKKELQLNTFTSVLRETLATSKQRTMTKPQLVALLEKAAIKPEEIEWTGLKEYMDALPEDAKVDLSVVLASLKPFELTETVKGELLQKRSEEETTKAAARLLSEALVGQIGAYTYNFLFKKGEFIGDDNTIAIEFKPYLTIPRSIYNPETLLNSFINSKFKGNFWDFVENFDKTEIALTTKKYVELDNNGEPTFALMEKDATHFFEPETKTTVSQFNFGVYFWETDPDVKAFWAEDLKTKHPELIPLLDGLKKFKDTRIKLIEIVNTKVLKFLNDKLLLPEDKALLIQKMGETFNVENEFISFLPGGPTRWDKYSYEELVLPGGIEQREFLIQLPSISFSGPHWEENSVIAHGRANTRFSPDGLKKILFTEEVQSDLHQKGRDYGYIGVEPTKEELEAKASIELLEKSREDEREKMKARIVSRKDQLLEAINLDLFTFEIIPTATNRRGAVKTAYGYTVMASFHLPSGETIRRGVDIEYGEVARKWFSQAYSKYHAATGITESDRLKLNALAHDTRFHLNPISYYSIDANRIDNLDGINFIASELDSFSFAEKVLDYETAALRDSNLKKLVEFAKYEAIETILAAMYNSPVKMEQAFIDPNSIYKIDAFTPGTKGSVYSDSLDKMRQLRAEIGQLLEKFNELEKVPLAPYMTSEAWGGLTLKRLISYAVEHGFDGIAWTTGEQQANRYNKIIIRNVTEIKTVREAPDTYNITVVQIDGTEKNYGSVYKDYLKDYVGKEKAKEIIASSDDTFVIRPAQDKTMLFGATGYVKFYEDILVKVANKIGKKYKTSVTLQEIEGIGKQPYLPITDEMRVSVLSEGLPLFNKMDPEKTPDDELVRWSDKEDAISNIKKLVEVKTDIGLITRVASANIDPSLVNKILTQSKDEKEFTDSLIALLESDSVEQSKATGLWSVKTKRPKKQKPQS